jgi:hypothetical protein
MSNQSEFEGAEIFSQTLNGLPAGPANVPIIVPAARWRLNTAGVYEVEVSVSRSTDSDTFTFLLPYFPASQKVQPVKLVPLWTIAAAPSLTSSQRYLSDSAINEYADQGAVSAAVKAAVGRNDLVWLIDPDTVLTAQRIAGGGEIEIGQAIAQEQSAAAQSWLDALKLATVESQVYSLPFANSDVNALINNDLDELAVRAITSADPLLSFLERSDIARAAIAHRGNFSFQTWKWLDEQGLYLTVVSDSKFAPSTTTYTPNGVTTVRADRKAFVTDSQLSRQFTGALLGNSRAALRRQALLADLMMISLERPSMQRTVIARPDTTDEALNFSNALDTLNSLSVPWVATETVADAFSTTTPDLRSADPGRVGAAIRQTAIKDIKWVERRLNRLEGLIGDTIVESNLRDAQLRLASATYLGTEVRAMRQATIQDVRNVRGSLEIISAGSVIFPGEESIVPITIRNDLPIDVTLRISAVGEPSVRVRANDVGIIEVASGKRKSLEIPTQLIGSDIAYLRLQLADENGNTFGNSVRIQLESTAYAQAAVWVIGAAFIFLVIFVILGVLRRVRSKSAME